MAEFSFQELAAERPYDLSRSLLRDYEELGPDTSELGIDESAVFVSPVRIHRVGGIGVNAHVGPKVTLEAGVWLGDNVEVERGTHLARSVRIGSVAKIGENNFFAPGAELPLDYTERGHPYMRKIEEYVTVGPGVVLPSEVQIGANAIIPTTVSIAEIGRFGIYQRMVTVYGSEDGPRYSAGCQYGIDINTLRWRVTTSEGTKPESASDYAAHLPEIEALGMTVQSAFDRDLNLVDELRQQRYELGY